MASEVNKKRAHHIYKLFNLFHWVLFVVVSVTDGLAIGFAEGTSGYWGGGLAVAIMMLFICIQDVVILKNVMTYDKQELDKKKFIDTFNWQGLNILLNFVACAAGIGVAAALGANYGKENGDDTKNSTESETKHDADDLVNVEENRIIGTLLAIFCGITLAVTVRTICLHGEVRAALGIPEKNTASASTTPTPATAAARPAAATPAANNQVQLLTTQNNLLKEQNRIQKEQLEQMTVINQQLQGISIIGAGRSVLPPPDYSSLASAGPPPGYQSPDVPPQNRKY